MGYKVKVLIGCEFSGTVREAFRAAGHAAMSVDLLPASDSNEFHLQMDVLDVLADGWDLAIFHPPCTHLAVSGARWLTDHWVTKKSHPEGGYWHDGSEKRRLQVAALDFVRTLLAAPIPRIALENPVSVISTKVRPPDQTIQPWMFGDPFQKRTCLWLKNLPPLTPTNVVATRSQEVWMMPPSEDRWKLRSITYPGIARAMAQQWGSLEP